MINNNLKSQIDIMNLLEKKIIYFHEIIQRSILYVQNNKMLDILGVSDVNDCINKFCEINKTIKEINIHNKTDSNDLENLINKLQNISNELSYIFKSFGTVNLDDLLLVCLGSNSASSYTTNDIDKYKFELLQKYFHPTSYKIMTKENDNPIKTNKTNKNNKNSKDSKDSKDNKNNKLESETQQNLECSAIHINSKSFHLKVYGMQVVFHNITQQKSIIVTGIVDDIIIDVLHNKFIDTKLTYIKNNIPNEILLDDIHFNRFLSCLTLKEYLIYNYDDIYSKFIGYIMNLNNIRIKSISQTMKDFLSDELLYKRLTIIQLLIFYDKYENQYLAYLLYDILSNDSNGNIDTQEQTILFDSFPWLIKEYFREAMKKTVQYTTDLLNFDIQKIPIEQQICLMKTTDIVKEKAMQKLKEVKSKSDDSGSKARQYLDGLLKIPFNVFKKEPILQIMGEIKCDFQNFINKHNITDISHKKDYTNLEISYLIKTIQHNIFIEKELSVYKKQILSGEKKYLLHIISKIEQISVKFNINYQKINNNSSKKDYLKTYILEFIDTIKNNYEILCELLNPIIQEMYTEIQCIEKKYKTINKFMKTSLETLNDAVYGHNKAKKQISRILGQWINGEQDGYCFGFEGPPGVGKTSLAKRGLSNCLKDENGVSRPFAMIQIGGDSNGSSLHGHNYTYVGSTWGSIAQILMDKKCMNPIIFIDEIDKISKTEHGREIIGILTHLLDPTQNDSFQDKYFTGIELDLSKALFILSYNDVDAIDRVLLDRIHRIKFSNLTLEDKLVICSTHILPELLTKMGLKDMITFSKEVLSILIEEYTFEPGVRKLKEVLFEIIGEINLDILNNFDNNYSYPLEISINDIRNKYFKEKQPMIPKNIHNENRIGFINGLWANAMGQGGVITIQCNYFPSEVFLNLKLTGMQGDVMKESMNVALTLAWNLTPKNIKEEIMNQHKTNLNGIHIHCPEGATPKDGPSAGTAITTCIYSLFNNLKINYSFAITGEISLDGDILEIGGLDLKILGGIKAGVKEFIFPKRNLTDFDNFMEKYKENPIIEGITFHKVEKIDEVFKLIFTSL